MKRSQMRGMKNWTALFNPPTENNQIICLYGGTASGKTYTALSWCIGTALVAAQEKKPFRACICRRTYPELRTACWDVALKILDSLDLVRFGAVTVRKSPTPQLVFGRSQFIDFRHADRAEEIKGAEYDVWMLDELTDIPRDFYKETCIRVPRGDSKRFMMYSRHILTWNPTSRGSWVYEEFFSGRPMRGVQLVQSTYLDNPHVSSQLVDKLLEWKENDPRRWQVYGLGEWGSPDELIYSRWRVASDDEMPATGRKYDAVGIDWGYANPTAVVGVFIESGRIIADEILYRSEMPVSEFRDWAVNNPGLKSVPIFCDPESPGSIEELRRVGIPADPAQNKPVAEGISWLQGRDILLTPRSSHLKREIAGYCWQRNPDGQLSDKPVKILDHACDALRYAAYTWHVKGYDVPVRNIKGILR